MPKMLDAVNLIGKGWECSSTSDEHTLRVALERLNAKLPVSVHEDASSSSQEGYSALVSSLDLEDNPYGDEDLYRQITWLCGWRRAAYVEFQKEVANSERSLERMTRLSRQALA